MTDLTEQFLPRLHAGRLPGLDLGSDFIYPDYSGGSLLNLPASICRMLGVPVLGAMPLRPEIEAAAGEDVQRVILLVLDGLGLGQLQGYLGQGLGQVWGQSAASLAPLTSISPSTTAAALTTLWTGASAAQHGIAGYEVWLREYGVVANMILHAPMSFGGDVGGLRRAGFVPEAFMPSPVLGPHLQEHGVRVQAFMHSAIARSGLSSMHLRGADVFPFRNPGDLTISLRDMLEQRAGERSYTYAYWGDLDELAHRFGPQDERIALEFEAFSALFQRSLLERLSPQARAGTLLILTADHGQVYTPNRPEYHLVNHPELARCLHIDPTGENRLAFLHLRPGSEDFVRQYIDVTWPGKFVVADSRQAIKAGLFGPGEPHPDLENRVGDLMVFARDDAYLWWARRDNPLRGRHGGLTPQEMLVPFLALRLDRM